MITIAIELEELSDAAFDCKEAGVTLEDALRVVRGTYEEIGNELHLRSINGCR